MRSCSDAPVRLAVSVTDATGGGGSQTWLAGTSTVPPANQFTWSVTPPGGPSPIPVGPTQTSVGLPLAAGATASPAQAVPLQVRQGQTVTIVPDCIETEFTVAPAIAGTTAVVNTLLPQPACRIDFTASSTYSGPVTVSSLVDTVQLIVVGEAAKASGSFTPVVAPGPCIVITANSVVSFGDVELGGGSTQGNVAPTLAGCAPSSVTQDVLIGATAASNGQTSLSVEEPTGCVLFCPPPAAGSYRVPRPVVPVFALVVSASSPALVLDNQAGDFSNESTELFVSLPSTLAPTFVGSLFTFDVTFTAITN